MTDAPLSATFTAPAGGIMTDEVGVITGEVELVSKIAQDNQAVATVRYAGALDWYTITDSAVLLGSPDELPTFHEDAVQKYKQPTQPSTV